MPKPSKRVRAFMAEYGAKSTQKQSLADAVSHLLDYHSKYAVKFVESIDVCFQLGIDAKKGDQNVRGFTSLPHGTGKTMRIAAFVEADQVKAALECGADIAGDDDLIARVAAGFVDFDVCIATPDMMRKMASIAKILGPRGLMPNPKVGTVTKNIAETVRELKRGRVEFRNDRVAGEVKLAIGKANFTKEQLEDNFKAVLAAVRAARPVALKGTYIHGVVVSTTMGPGFAVDINV